MIYIMFMARFIPDRVGVDTALEDPRRYLTCVIVKGPKDGKNGGALVGKTLLQTTIPRAMDLVRIERATSSRSASAPRRPIGSPLPPASRRINDAAF